MYELLLVEDDAEQLAALERILTSYPNEHIHVTPVCDYAAAMQRIKTTHFDLFFLDVLLSADWKDPGNGIQLGRAIRSLEAHRYTPIIYVTSVPELMNDALSDTSCFHYILKPYGIEQIYTTLDRVLHSPLVKPPGFYFTSFWGGETMVPESEIVWFASNSFHRLTIHTIKTEFQTAQFTLTELEHRLTNGFLRIHKGYLVHLPYITEYDKTRRTILIDGATIPVGRQYKKALDEYWAMR